MSMILKDALDETLIECIGKKSDELSIFELKKWARNHKEFWGDYLTLATTTSNATEAEIRAQLVQNAYKWVGTPYSVLDCSDLVQTIYEETIPQAKKDGSFATCAANQAEFCHNSSNIVILDPSLLKPGDLIFWSWKGADSMNGRFLEIDHVGMVMENNGGSFKVIESRNSDSVQEVTIENTLRNSSCFTMGASPVLLYTGQVINDVPGVIKDLDVYGMISTSELIGDKILNNGEIYKYYYCSCEYCRDSNVTDMTGLPREIGHMAIPSVSQIEYKLTAETQSAVGDETGTVMSIDGKLYKCVDYSEGRFALSLDTVGLYTEDNGEYYGRIVWSDGTLNDGIDIGESFINDHIDAINRTYAHQIRTRRYGEDYRVLSIDPESLIPAHFDTYRYSGNPGSEYVTTGGR